MGYVDVPADRYRAPVAICCFSGAGMVIGCGNVPHLSNPYFLFMGFFAEHLFLFAVLQRTGFGLHTCLHYLHRNRFEIVKENTILFYRF